MSDTVAESPLNESAAAPDPEPCANCGTEITARFCGHCGQERRTTVAPVRDLVAELLEEFLKFDSRLVNTLRLLILQPGLLTEEYLSGHRVRYVAPFKLYFGLTALFFLAFTLTGGSKAMLQLGPPATSATEEANLQRYAAFFAENLSLLIFLLVPALAGFLWLLHRRGERPFYVQHLVFSVHVHAFIYLVALVSLALPAAWSDWVDATVPVLYLFLAMLGFYRQHWLKTLGKLVVALIGYALCFLILVSVLAVAFHIGEGT